MQFLEEWASVNSQDKRILLGSCWHASYAGTGCRSKCQMFSEVVWNALLMNPCTGNESFVVYFLHCELSIDKERWDVQ